MSSTAPTTRTLGSLVERTEGAEPWEYYERLREVGDVVWDEQLEAWLVSSYELVREMSRHDDDLWERNLVVREGMTHLGMSDERWEWFMGAGSARAALFMVTGEQQVLQHRWWMRAFSPRVLEQWRDTLYRPICDEQIDNFAELGRAELVEDYAQRVAERVMAGMLGLPTHDPAWLARLVDCFDERGKLMVRHSIDKQIDPELVARAFAATDELYAELLPFVRERKGTDGDDFVSMVWREAPELFGPDFHERDVFSATVTMWQGGAGSVARAAVNALYLLLTSPQVHDRVRTDERARRTFIEESLRLFEADSWRARYAKADVQLGDVLIKRGDLVLALTTSAHHDPRQYPKPYEVDLDRASPRDHFGFFAGPRACPGQGLARVEIEQVLLALLERLPDIRLDPDAAPPQLLGLRMRTWSPLNVVF